MNKSAPHPLFKLATELGPLLIFFAANAKFDLFVATGAFMVAIVASLIVSYVVTRHVPIMAIVSGVIVLVFGTLTLVLHDETFIKIKPTIYYAVVTALLVFGMATGRNLLKAVLGSAYPGLSERGWHLLTRNWAAYFAVMAVLNEVVWRTQTTNFWVSFKLWFFLPATFVFAALNVPMLMRHGLTLEEAEEEQPTVPTE